MLISFACKLQSNRADCTTTNAICTVHVHTYIVHTYLKDKVLYHSTVVANRDLISGSMYLH